MSENVYYLYGFKKGENRLKAKPIEVASVPFEELLQATQQAKDMGFVGVYALTKALHWGHYRTGNQCLLGQVAVGRMV